MYLSQTVWIWLIVGILLILSEFIVPGFVICFFGVAALVVAGIVFFFPDLAFSWQLFICGVTGVALLLLCRKYMPGTFLGKKGNGVSDIDLDDVIGADCVCVIPVTGKEAGKVDFRGSHWTAVADENIEVGDLCVVIARNNLTLTIKKK